MDTYATEARCRVCREQRALVREVAGLQMADPALDDEVDDCPAHPPHLKGQVLKRRSVDQRVAHLEANAPAPPRDVEVLFDDVEDQLRSLVLTRGGSPKKKASSLVNRFREHSTRAPAQHLRLR